MIPRWNALFVAVLACQHCTKARRPARPAFVVRARTRVPSGGDTVAAHNLPRTVGRNSIAPLPSATEKTDTTQELSDLDARVIDELLSDPTFMESLLQQGIKFEKGDEEDGAIDGLGGESSAANNTAVDKPTRGGLAKAGEWFPRERNSSYESATMKVVEELQDSVRGLLAKMSAAIESAGIYVSNRAQMDTKVVQTVVDYASKQAAAGTGQLLLAATGAASPALLLMGINNTETQNSLNDSLQLLSMGIVPDSVGATPKLLPSFKDFDDDDKRLDAAYRRQRRRRSKPLPAKLLGALPSTINKAADLAYEVEQEVKYERAGSRANKLLKPVGLLLPEAKDNTFLLGRKPAVSSERLLKAPASDNVSKVAALLPTRVPDAGMEKAGTPEEARPMETGVLQKASVRREPLPPAPDPFGIFTRFRQTIASPKDKDLSASVEVEAREIEAGTDATLAAILATRPHVLSKELVACSTCADNELRLQEQSQRAAEAVLCCTEPILADLENTSVNDMEMLEQLRSVTRNVQQLYVLAEMTQAVDAAEAQLARLKELSANVNRLAGEIRVYMPRADHRMERLVTISSGLREAREVGDLTDSMGMAELDFVDECLELLQSFDVERNGRQQDTEAVEEWLDVVRGDSAERARGDAGNVHEQAFVAACRLWEASSQHEFNQQVTTVDRIKLEVARLEQPEVEVPPPAVPEVAQINAGLPGSEGRQAGVAEVARAGPLREVPETEQVWVETNKQAQMAHSSTQETRGAQTKVGATKSTAKRGARVEADTGESAANVDGKPRLGESTANPQVTPESSPEKLNTPTESPFDFIDVNEDALDATVVSESVARSLDKRNIRQTGAASEGLPDSFVDNPAGVAGAESTSIEVAVGEHQAFVDIEADVEDDVSDTTRVGLKVLDVSALLLEKILFIGLPTVLAGGAVVWERVDNAMNGAKGRKGWRLLKRLKKDSVGRDDTRE